MPEGVGGRADRKEHWLLHTVWVSNHEGLSWAMGVAGGSEWMRSGFFFFFFCIFAFSRAAPVACGGSQARGQIGAVAPAYARATATRDLSHICNLHHSSQQCWILNPLIEARDRTHNLMVPSRIHLHCTMMGTLQLSCLYTTVILVVVCVVVKCVSVEEW